MDLKFLNSILVEQYITGREQSVLSILFYILYGNYNYTHVMLY